MKILVVVDMQGHFSPIPTRTTDNVIAAIRSGKRRKLPIVILEDVACGPTLSRVMKAAGKKAIRAERLEGSGKQEILEALGVSEIEAVEVCGIYTSACVRCLVDDLERETNVTVIENACWDCGTNHHEEQIEEWRGCDWITVK